MSIGKRDGGPVSTKHGSTGLNAETVRRTAERHHGTATFDYGDGVFMASVMLCLDD
ncbi:ATP-binding protein [Bifidobacterium catenulatum]|uniref:ATP-binding protein n=1 Tax=Bifidobacterium catenulatum TaxID=1686 RepID=UPI0011773301|nr:ATP-binding protein [Bifidobacterium catenulatum]